MSFGSVVSWFCHTPTHTEVAKTQFPKSESAHPIFEEIACQPWRKLAVSDIILPAVVEIVLQRGKSAQLN
jgi:hypothetical protein